ncbi:Bacterial alpha-L-rhamnosidase [Ginsengibacter hankyongi]|uniref:alpha-L-rhamnosidase n=1 Tax=Ginsengibacter hankyongi TaxID=2607284 RepID=A0A5J5IBB9_9BACT|nr:alpha-L-rhamnosidase [Ginsengibacter hankyongi]KAA9035645.1 Bacterial alpha-L-rhamnosidase [Ginsengibacter hankyongi]
MKKFIGIILFQCIGFLSFSQVNLKQLLCNNCTNPIGIGTSRVRFTWQLHSNKRNVMQSGYEIRVSESEPLLQQGKKLEWNSGKILSDQSVYVDYKGSPLQSNKKYYWQVRVWDNEGKLSDWSQPAFFQTAFFQTNDWKAKWIQPGFIDSVGQPSPMFRKQFTAKKKIKSATAYITAHGLYEAQINGQRVGDAYFTPGWTSYNKRLQYQAYDVTNLLKKGSNAIGVTLGSGWYRGHLAWGGNKNIYGKDISLLLQLIITYTDGTMQTIVSDGSWKSTTGSVISSSIYDGETIDDRAQKADWTLPGYDDSKWSGVKMESFSNDNLIATINEPAKKHETIKPVKVITTPKGEKVIDFGQNLVGWVMLKVKGNTGDTVIIKHAEVLDKEGNFYTTNLRAAKATSTYILNGKGEEYFEPHFTYYGFRYIKVEGIKGALNPEDFTAVAIYADMKETGTFSTSNAMINQLQHNIQWGQKGNFLDVPTDCPQRDERLGWTGDAQVFSPTASFNMNVNNFLDKWMKDVAADQFPDGRVPHVIPNVLGPDAGGSTGWSDVSTIIPWNMYLAYGDKQILEDQYSSMKAWVEYMHKQSHNNLWNTGTHFGDWLFYRPDDDNSGRAAVTDKYLIAQCFYAHSTQLLISSAKVLGKTDDVDYYTDLLQKIKGAFLKEYVTPNGRLVSSTQTAYVLALNFDMLPESLRTQAAERLVENIKSYNNHLSTGFLGTPYLCHVLTRFGYDDVAYKLLLQTTYPSWLYPVKMGATTIWERWDGEKPDSTFENPGMNSFNHYAYGAIGDWMYRKMVGLDTYEDGVGYKHIKIQPHIGGGFTYASASLQTYYGKVSNSWKIENHKILMDVEIPANTKATVFVPAESADAIKESGNVLSQVLGIKLKNSKDGYVALELGSGTYHFEIQK